MEFRFTDEQNMIRDSAAAFLQDVSTPAAVRKAMVTEAGYDPELWRRICQELCFQAITVPEAYGGMGLGQVELAAVLEQMGRVLLCSPFFATVGLGVNALLLAGSEAQKQQYLPAIVAGELTATLAWTGPQAARRGGQWGCEALGAEWQKTAEGYQLSGELRYVIDGHTAGLLIVAARQAASQGREGIALFCVPAGSQGLNRQWQPGMDQTRHQARIVLNQVCLPESARLAPEADGAAVLETLLDLAKLAMAAEQAGAARQVLDMSVSYMQARVQFGRPVAGYQALKHKAADMLLKCEVSRSAVYYAACVAQEAIDPDGDKTLAGELREAAAMAKAYCSDTFFFNAGTAIQLHGGVGFTWEYDVHLYFKRAKASELYLGSGAAQRELIASLLLG
ncbi:acyl-CoA dehydrogenase family protein [Halopseudomonas phragmitis]|uniref:Acyl-CoA dehydrogenase n=1 Tax=Halopseudomonas phragmitis TaxID=1931241 RepID=A0A1V0B995_9GAMM|nr:acyl-CoA dehydrogenase family protein [Halopseudomonas phragmitis]AQZ96460.1 acyl-CoA dehydrogenase [Halopseudomonas phragmitis]